MTDVIMDEKIVERPDMQGMVRLDDLDEQLIGQLVDRARSEGLRLTGEDGLLAQLSKRIIESAAEGEMDVHLGYAKHDPAGPWPGSWPCALAYAATPGATSDCQKSKNRSWSGPICWMYTSSKPASA